MKLLVTIIAAVVLGLVIGVSSATLRARSEKPPEGAKVQVDSEAFDFGEMDVSKDGSHDFIFTNNGVSPLHLSRGATSCSCTLGEIGNPVLAPGQSTKVHVTWKSKMHRYVGVFKQNVTINTNDPNRAEVALVIKGEYTEALHVTPDELNFNQITSNQPVTREARILSKLSNPPLKITGCELDDHELGKFFLVDTRPLTPEEVQQTRGTKSGVLVTVTAKPGLPPGRFQPKILLRTNVPATQEIELPLYGSMGKDVSVAGKGWDDDIGLLTIGPVKVGTSEQRQLMLIARGKDAKDVRYNVVHVEPDFLKVKLGKTELREDGKLSETPLLIEIPPRNAPASFIGNGQGEPGEIHVDTTSSDVHQLRIRVRFAIK